MHPVGWLGMPPVDHHRAGGSLCLFAHRFFLPHTDLRCSASLRCLEHLAFGGAAPGAAGCVAHHGSAYCSSRHRISARQRLAVRRCCVTVGRLCYVTNGVAAADAFFGEGRDRLADAYAVRPMLVHMCAIADVKQRKQENGNSICCVCSVWAGPPSQWCVPLLLHGVHLAGAVLPPTGPHAVARGFCARRGVQSQQAAVGFAGTANISACKMDNYSTACETDKHCVE